jgi:RNA polymerase sigma-70 factor, ECF subfamily
MEAHRRALTGHCYRMLGSVADADDAVQETLLRAWKGSDGFDARSSLRTWLYRIATNVCLDEIAKRSKGRVRPMEEGPAGSPDAELTPYPRAHWLEPAPDVSVIPSHDTSPAETAILRQSVRLAFVAALQHLPARQRAALLLTDVLGWSAVDAAATLDMTVASVNSAIQRARATLAARSVSLDTSAAEPLSARHADLLQQYVDAFHRFDPDHLVSLLREDAAFCMPPFALWLTGRADVRTFLLGRGSHCRGSKLIPAPDSCGGSPTFAIYHPAPEGNGYLPWAVVVLEIEDGWITAWNSFLDVETLLPRFGLPPSLPPHD